MNIFYNILQTNKRVNDLHTSFITCLKQHSFFVIFLWRANNVFKFLMLWFQAVGCVLISIASWITHFAKLYQDLFIDDNLLVVTSLLIAVGTFLFIFSFIGCLGALKEGPFILKLVSFLTVYFLKSFPLYFNFIFRSVCLSE